VFDRPTIKPETTLWWIKNAVKKYVGITLPLVIGRGFLQYSFGLIPKRFPITTVVGKPIEVIMNPDPTDEEIEILHKLFIKNLQDLFESNKAKYSNFPSAELFIE
jgi:2-acylglycerol O-acyltransferase 2